MRFTLLLAALFLVNGGFVSIAFGQEGSLLDEHISLDDVFDDIALGHTELEGSHDDESSSEPSADLSVTGDTTMESPITLSFFAGGNVMKAHTRGNETWTESQSLFAGATIRTHVGDVVLWAPFRVEAGVHVRGSFTEYESEHTAKYSGDGGEIAAGPEIYIRHAPDASVLPWISLELRLLFGYAKGRGSLEDGSYRAVIETTYANLGGTLNILWPFRLDRRINFINSRQIMINGREAVITEGFFPKIELRWDWKIPLHISKRTTATRDGLRDPAYERSFDGVLRFHLWRVVTNTTNTDEEALWEVSFGPFVGLRWFQSNGRVSMDDGKSVYSYSYGAFVYATINRRYGFELAVIGTRQTGKHQEVGAIVSLHASF